MNSTKKIESLKLLAVLLSLPLILLLWSLITFAFSVGVYAFSEALVWWNYTTVGILIAVVAGVVIFTLGFFWGIFDQNSSAHDESLSVKPVPTSSV